MPISCSCALKQPWPVSRDLTRRRVLASGLVVGALLGATRLGTAQTKGTSTADGPRQWMNTAFAMKHLAESWGDQSYGAVLVLGDKVVGEGPSRVVKLGDPSAHAEREAIRDAQRHLGNHSLAGSILYSTSRPCSLCESAAAQAGVARMFHGEALLDAGKPSLR